MLSKRINLSTGLGHASDFDAAISMFKLLREQGYDWSGDEVRDWARGGGWDPEDVAELGTVADVVQNYGAASWHPENVPARIRQIASEPGFEAEVAARLSEAPK